LEKIIYSLKNPGYFDLCKKLISDLGLESEVETTGFISESEIDSHCQNTSLVITAFGEIFGSGLLFKQCLEQRQYLLLIIRLTLI
tara:strand:- start:13215 stop:13469 length:255 start_codon:yes stop_codon:yes gene_type:complete